MSVQMSKSPPAQGLPDRRRRSVSTAPMSVRAAARRREGEEKYWSVRGDQAGRVVAQAARAARP